MTDNRIRSMVPLFGGGDRYVETLNQTLRYVAAEEPTHEELIEWHRGEFANVESQKSIERRLRYIQNLDFIQQAGDRWTLADAGRRYLPNQDREVLFDIMAERNVGLQSLLFELAHRPMTIEAVNDFLLETNEVLGWDPTETDMAKQRVNWLRSLRLVERTNGEYRVTDIGQRYVDEIQSVRTVWQEVAEQAGTRGRSAYMASVSQTTTSARYLDPEFRAVVLRRYDSTCPVSTVDHPMLLDVAHVLPWSEYPDRRADFGNVLPLSKTIHAAFDAELFTLDEEMSVRVRPNLETDSEILQRTLLDRQGEQLSLPSNSQLQSEYIAEHNQALEWV